MPNKPGPRRGSIDETIAPPDDSRAAGADETLAPAAPARPAPDATIEPSDTARRAPDETVAPTDVSRQPPTVDLPPMRAGLNATIDSIPSLSAGNRGAGAAAAPRPQVEGYTILSELGRGGMGVVYKARQKKLNRIVALKMVLAGAHAGQDQLARFYTEAEAVAHLQQPHIVQIYEVGEHAGLPYFSLEYVDGGSLSERIDGKPQPVEDAARMLEQLARAMAYAHEQGIIHRDLKPANVLITREGEPKITDFGLAKRLESDASQTKSGTLMGTPNYMAPEQAKGLVHEIGPLADVYALGVILYEMLTGRTPFLGTSILDTLQQVRNLEPVPPSRLQPKVPRDLETICLKCLQKEPSKRYDDAGALADDLARFVAGEPILARPVSAPERFWRWCRRNPRIAALSAAVLLLLVSLAVGGPVAAIWIFRNEQKARIAQAAAEANKKKADAARTEADANAEVARSARVEAEANEKKAMAAREEADENARVAAEQRDLAVKALQKNIAAVHSMRDTAATQKLKGSLLQNGLDGLRKVAESSQTARIANGMIAETHQLMGDTFLSIGELKDAHQQYELGHSIRQALATATPNDPEARRHLAFAVSRLGDVSRLEGNLELARQHYSEGLKLREALAAEHPTEMSIGDLATSYVMLGNVSEPERARSFYGMALTLRQRIVTNATDKMSASARANRQRNVWLISNRLGELSLRLADLSAARDYYRQGLQQATKLSEWMKDSPQAKRDLADGHLNLGNVELRFGDFAAANENFSLALNLLVPLAREDPQNLDLQSTLALVLANKGEHLGAVEKIEELRRLAPQNPNNLYNVGCRYAVCASAVARNKSASELTSEEGTLRREYADKAIAALKEAVARGFKNKDLLSSDPELEAIREHPEFAKLVAEMK